MTLGLLYLSKFNFDILHDGRKTLLTNSMADRVILKWFFQVVKNLAITANYSRGCLLVIKSLKLSEMPFLAINSSMISRAKIGQKCHFLEILAKIRGVS